MPAAVRWMSRATASPTAGFLRCAASVELRIPDGGASIARASATDAALENAMSSDAEKPGDPLETHFRRNIEIKARIDDWGAAVAKAKALAGSCLEHLHQHDSFFHTPRGRLKLREFSPERGQLIYYERPDQSSAKLSRYMLYETSAPAELRALLAASLEIRGTVTKERLVFLHGKTRIHLDRVEGLGEFLELEVVLDPSDDERASRETANALLKGLGISPMELLEGAYIDLIERC